MDAFVYCQEKVAASRSSFYYSFLLLPPAQRQAMFNLYAFCREVDDIVDDCIDPQIASKKLQWWRQQIQLCYIKTDVKSEAKQEKSEKPSLHLITQALQKTIDEYQLPQNYFLDILDGMQQDLQQTRYLDFKQLSQYCWRAAGAVGSLSIYILSKNTNDINQASLEYAEYMGLALQLINIIRDVGEDARRGRIYLPVNDLQKFNVPAHQILKLQSSPEFIELMRFYANTARDYYQKALAALPKNQYKAQRAGLMMGAIYHQLLDVIEENNFPVMSQKISLTAPRKLWLCMKNWLKYA